MSKIDKTFILPIFNHSPLNNVPGQKCFSGVSYIFCRMSDAGSLVNPSNVDQKNGLNFMIYNGPFQETHLLLLICLQS